jgi:hypothetical protein
LAARKVWEEFYSPAVRFHWLAEDCLEMLALRRRPEWLAGRLAWRHLLDGKVMRRFLLSKKQVYRESGRVVF